MMMYVAASFLVHSATHSYSKVYNNRVKVASRYLHGRKMMHHKLTQQQLEQRHQTNGNSKDFAHYLATLDVGISNGAEDRKNDVVQATIRREPQKFRAFVEANSAMW